MSRSTSFQGTVTEMNKTTYLILWDQNGILSTQFLKEYWQKIIVIAVIELAPCDKDL